MRMLCAAEPGTLAPPQPWCSAELFSLAAGVGVNGEKPHQGVASKKAAPHQAEIARNSTIALGLSWCWWSGTAPGARVTYDYDAWGNAVNTTGSTPNAYLYRGEQYDSDLRLYYLRARYLNPLSGRFLTEDPEAGDPKDPISLHRYMYAASDPVDNYDPTGRATLSPIQAPPEGPVGDPNIPGVQTPGPSEYQIITRLVLGTAVVALPLAATIIAGKWLAANNTLTAASAAASGQSPAPTTTTNPSKPCYGNIHAHTAAGLKKQEAWAQATPPTSGEGLGLLLALTLQLTGREAKDLAKPLAQAQRWIGQTCPAAGGCGPLPNKPFYGQNGSRIDVEIWYCKAFI